jgi:hypothetical protein
MILAMFYQALYSALALRCHMAGQGRIYTARMKLYPYRNRLISNNKRKGKAERSLGNSYKKK